MCQNLKSATHYRKSKAGNSSTLSMLKATVDGLIDWSGKWWQAQCPSCSPHSAGFIPPLHLVILASKDDSSQVWWSTSNREYYLRNLMQEGVHYLSTDGLFQNLTQVVQWARARWGDATDGTGWDGAKNVFSRHGLIFYMSQLLKSWSNRMAFKPQLQPGAFLFVSGQEYQGCHYQPHLFQAVPVEQMQQQRQNIRWTFWNPCFTCDQQWDLF